MVVVAVFALAFILVLFLCSLRPSSDKRAVNVDVVENGEAAKIRRSIRTLIENYRNALHSVARQNGRKCCGQLGRTPAQPFPCWTGRRHHWRRRVTADEVIHVIAGYHI